MSSCLWMVLYLKFVLSLKITNFLLGIPRKIPYVFNFQNLKCSSAQRAFHRSPQQHIFNRWIAAISSILTWLTVIKTHYFHSCKMATKRVNKQNWTFMVQSLGPLAHFLEKVIWVKFRSSFIDNIDKNTITNVLVQSRYCT